MAPLHQGCALRWANRRPFGAYSRRPHRKVLSPFHSPFGCGRMGGEGQGRISPPGRVCVAPPANSAQLRKPLSEMPKDAVMIGDDDARRLAEEHVAEQPQPHPDYYLALGTAREISLGWYFDYAIRGIRDIPAHQQEQFGGAPGFVVHREDGRVEVIAWGQYQDMGLANE
jgi:hypothetical protein